MIIKNHFRSLPQWAALFLVVANGSSLAQADESLEVFVSIPPLKQVVERVGGDHVRVQYLLRPGSDPHSYEPTVKQVGDLARADLFFEIGLPFEKQVADKVRAMDSAGLEVIDAAAGIEPAKFEPSPTNGKHDHDDHHGHDHDHAHHHGAKDPHIWLDTRLLAQVAQTMADALISHEKTGEAADNEIRENLSRLQEDLKGIAGENAELLEPYRGEILLVYHPAFGYFARQYGLRQWAIEAGGKSPSARQIGRIVDLAREKGAKVIFVQPQFSPASGELIAERIGGEVQPMNPLAEDLLGNLRNMAQTVAEAYQKQQQ